MKFRIGATALAAAALAVAGCGGGGDKSAMQAGSSGTTTSASMSQTSSGKATADGAGASLRASLTAGLQDHVYLAGIAVEQGVAHGLGSAQFKAAAATLDKNSVALSRAVEGIYGADAGARFLKLWRQHVGFFVDYAAGRATKDAALVAKANRDLDGYRASFGAFLAEANPNLTAEAVSNDLKGHITTLEAAIDSVVAKKTNAFDLLQAAASHMPGTAQVLAGAIQKQFPERFPS